MAVSATAKSLINADSYSTKWHQKRIHRKLDDRDDVLDEALQIIESHDASALPRMTGMTGFGLSQASPGSSSATLTVGGAGCTAASTVTLVLGATSIDVTAGVNEVTVDTDGDVDTVIAATTAGGKDVVPVYLTVDGVLCPVITLITLA
jgi:hypothetical protein